jgi:hypothetical protein
MGQTKGIRKKKARFIAIPHSVLRHPDYRRLRGTSVKLLNDLVMQFNGSNNGNLSAAWGLMSPLGWNSKETVTSAVKQLIEHGLIVKTRDGRFQNPNSRCDLYALTWHRIDECEGKDLFLRPTRGPYRTFFADDIKSPSPKNGQGSTQKLGRDRKRGADGRYVSS